MRSEAPAAAAILIGAVVVLAWMAWSTNQTEAQRLEVRRQDARREQEAVRQQANIDVQGGAAGAPGPVLNVGGVNAPAPPAQVAAQDGPIKVLFWRWPTPTIDHGPGGGEFTYDDPDVVTGKVQNVSSSRLSLVTVDFNLYDDVGNRIGTAQSAMNGLDAGDVWKFRALVGDRRVKKVTFGSIIWF